MRILQFSEDNLADALSNKYTAPNLIKAKLHFKYFLRYLGTDGLNANTIFIEEPYISRDFLTDYASYYALCFENYPKECKRVHFFRQEFDESVFRDVILKKDGVDPDFWDHYLGFIVVKPIPYTIIGYTILKTFDSGSDFDSRNFWGLRPYTIHILGNEIKICSLAFQEQDSVLAACATTAIWTMLNKASSDYYTTLKSPSQITKDADRVSPDGGRLFPNKGLSVLQICNAIVNSGLVCEIKQADYIDAGQPCISNTYLKKILNAYSSIGIPIILVVRVPSGNGFGLHAIVVSGFNQKSPVIIPPMAQISFLSENIEKIYAHDDQWGPFARICFNNESDLVTPWTEEDPAHTPTKLLNIVVPVYPKIRISYEDIEVIVIGLDTILTLFFAGKIIADLTWDIKIEYSENFKKKVVSSSLTDSYKIKLLSTGLPKYLWVVSCCVASIKILDFTFDATNVSNAMIGKDVICYLPSDARETFHSFLEVNHGIFKGLVQHKAGIDYYNFIIEKLK